MNPPSKILIVDDEFGGRQTLAGLLHTANYELAMASNGLEALTIAAQIEPDLILLDVMMPGMDGYTVCQQLRATPALAQVPIVMVTALDDDDSRLQGLQAGADDFVSKPFNRAELRARVQTITRLNRQRRLVAERAKFEWAIEQARDGYVVLDDDDQIIYANALAKNYLRLANLPAPFLPTVQPTYQCQPPATWENWRVEQTGEPRYLIQPATARTPACWLRVDVLTVPMTTPAQRVVCLRDVSEDMLQRAQRGSLQGTLLHKMRTPLMGLLGSLELLTGAPHEDMPDESREMAELAYLSGKRLADQVETLLTYLTAPTQLTQGIATSLSGLPTLIEQFAQDLQLANVTVQVSDDAKTRAVTLSQTALESVLWEILSNAIKFHPAHMPTIQVQVTATAPAALLQISDDGNTLTPTQLSQVWLPYYQAEKNRTGEVPGMGLGLATVATLVWSVGGTCRMFNRTTSPGIIVELALPWS